MLSRWYFRSISTHFYIFFLKRILFILLSTTFTIIKKLAFLFIGGFFKKINLPLKIALFVYQGLQLLGCLLLRQQSVKPGAGTNWGDCLLLSCAGPYSWILNAEKGQSPSNIEAHFWTSLIHEQIKLCFFPINRCLCFPQSRPEWACFPHKITAIDSCKQLCNFLKLNYCYFRIQHIVGEDSHLLLCEYAAMVLQAACSHAPRMHKMTLLCPQRNFCYLFKASAAARSYFGGATPNKFHDKC